jgi:tRNA threonylcarbamoyladenosine biosynthesis protein TsaE
MYFTNVGLVDLDDIANYVLEKETKIVLFVGDLGAGKTTLIKKLCDKLGVKDEMSSPTFSIVNEYQAEAGLVYHFDLYRIEKSSELYDLGFEDYLDSDQYCFIEWPEIAENILRDYDKLVVKIELKEDQSRLIFVE